MPFFIIGTFEMLEYFESYKKMLVKKDGNVSRIRLCFIRGIGTSLIILICLLFEDVSTVTEFAGNLFMPLVGYTIPVFMVHAKAYWIDKKRKSVLRILHDLFVFTFSIFIMAHGTYQQMYNEIK